MNFILLALAISVVVSSGIAQAQERIFAEQGVAMIERFDPHQGYSLYGEWLYVPNQLLSPDAALQLFNDPSHKKQYVIPGTSFGAADPVGHQSDIGFGTYLLRVEGLPPGRKALFGQNIFSSAQIFVFTENGAGSHSPSHA